MKAFVLGSVLLLASVCSGSYIPADTPEVAAAKAAHLAAHAHVAAHAAPAHNHWGPAHDGPAQKWHGPIHIPQIHNGVPVETPEVQHAKAFHAAAYAKVSAYPSHGPAPLHAPVAPAHLGAGAWHGPQHVPVIHNGVPVETPEVQHAKAAHLNALASAGAHGPAPWAAHGHGHEDDGSYKPHLYEAPHY
ncbi:cuticle protein 18.7-like [Armigeres subalbatus]|uniref:cuticle protein 18.7-like n=1 Tax=Armigeres subalbatus TaxID=124917 RepID=UPI002ED17859